MEAAVALSAVELQAVEAALLAAEVPGVVPSVAALLVAAIPGAVPAAVLM